MRIPLHLRLILVGVCSASLLHAELVIVKHEENHLAPLDASDQPHWAAIADVLLKYEWPMVITNMSLTKRERDELLTPNKPRAEEEFIKNKLQKIDRHYDIAFLPTALYELFVATHIQIGYLSSNPFGDKEDPFIKVQHIVVPNPRVKHNEKAEYAITYESVYREYNKFNNEFYQEAFFFINSALAKVFLDYGPFKTGSALSEAIQQKAPQIAAQCIKVIESKINAGLGMLAISTATSEILKDSNILDPHKPIAKVFALEYEAREANKALLLRGTNILKDVYLGAHKGELAGSSIKLETESLHSLVQAYKKETLIPYSTSFGNSLFAGVWADSTAAVYTYLNAPAQLFGCQGQGYALLINKKAYITNHLNNLFFISALAPLAAFFGAGEIFHSRSKGAKINKGKTVILYGLAWLPFIDSEGVLVIERDPLRHAELFADFLAKNMQIITTSCPEAPYGEEKETYEKHLQKETAQEIKSYEKYLQEEQAKAARYYKAVRTLEPFATKASRTFRQRKLEKLHKEQPKNVTEEETAKKP